MNQELAHIKPIVLFGIGQHYKRKTIQLKSKDFLLLGLLYGERQNLNLRINFSTPIKATQDPKQNRIQKDVFINYVTKADKLVRIDHPGNNLRNLDLVGIYLLRQNLALKPQDQEIIRWLAELGFNNQRLLLINFEKKDHQIFLYKEEHDKLVETAYTNATEQSETICIKGLHEKSNASPYLKILETNYNLLQNYNQKLVILRGEVEKEENLEKIREITQIVNGLKQLAGDQAILEEINAAVMFNLTIVMTLEKRSEIM